MPKVPAVTESGGELMSARDYARRVRNTVAQMTGATFFIEFEIDREAFERGDLVAVADIQIASESVAASIGRRHTSGPVTDLNGERIGTFGVKPFGGMS